MAIYLCIFKIKIKFVKHKPDSTLIKYRIGKYRAHSPQSNARDESERLVADKLAFYIKSFEARTRTTTLNSQTQAFLGFGCTHLFALLICASIKSLVGTNQTDEFPLQKAFGLREFAMRTEHFFIKQSSFMGRLVNGPVVYCYTQKYTTYPWNWLNF